MKHAVALMVLLACLYPCFADQPVRVGSKSFTESVILGEVAKQLIEESGISAKHQELGGTKVLWEALRTGRIDVYPEYTGTLQNEVFAGKGIDNFDDLRRQLAKHGIKTTDPLGFENTYMIGVTKQTAEILGLARISDLRKHSGLRLDFSNEFCDREDGWPSLKRHYRLPHKDVRGLDHDLAYRALAQGEVDVTDFYSTDAKLSRYPFIGLADDEKYFPSYQAVYLYREELNARHPKAVDILRRTEGKLTEELMIATNARTELDSIPESAAAAGLLRNLFGIERVEESFHWSRLLATNALQHLKLVAASLSLAVLVGIPLGIAAAKIPALGQGLLAVVGLVQTLPSIVLLVLLIPLLGIGDTPAIFALFIYSLLPIVRNTHAGLRDISRPLLESAIAVGLTPTARLRRIEIPLASRSILAGIKTAAVINVGTATLGGFIGAGGFGQPIFQGLRRDDWNAMILQGALPAAILSLVVLGLFEVVERFAVPKGLRLKPPSQA